MNPIQLIMLLFVVQIGSYLLLDKANIFKWNWLILIGLIVSYIFIIPRFYFPEKIDDEPNCGMPIVALTLVFWFLGCGATVFTHFIYILIKHQIIKPKKSIK